MPAPQPASSEVKEKARSFPLRSLGDNAGRSPRLFQQRFHNNKRLVHQAARFDLKLEQEIEIKRKAAAELELVPKGNLSRSESKSSVRSVGSQKSLSPQDSGRLSKMTGLFVKKSFPQKLKKFKRVLSKHQDEVESRSLYLAKFQVKSIDPISIAFLAAASWRASAAIYVSSAIPLVVMLLLAIVLAQRDRDDYPGLDYLQFEATTIELTLGILGLGSIVIVNILGPLIRPFEIVRLLGNMRAKLDQNSVNYSAAWWGLLRAEFSLFLLYFTSITVILVSAAASILNSADVIPLLWTTLALAWLGTLSQVLLSETVFMLYRRTSVTIAISDLEFSDRDTEKEFWLRSWTSKAEIRKGLVNSSLSSMLKLQLLTDPDKGLGLGSSREGNPEVINFETLVVQWGEAAQKEIEGVGPIAARAVQPAEWTYDMSREQRRLFFKFYPLRASELPWSGNVVLDVDRFEVRHVSGIVRMLENKANGIDKLYLHSNEISDEGISLIAEALKANLTVKQLWLHANSIGDVGGVNLAKALQYNTSLQTLHLRGNNLGNAAALEFAEALRRNTSLVSLGLDNNRIGDLGVQHLLYALAENKSLKKLWLMDNDVSEEKVAEIASSTGVYDRIALLSHKLLPPVIKYGVRAKLEELKLDRKSKRTAMKYLKNWSNAMKRTEQVNSRARSDSADDIDVEEIEVQEIVMKILETLPNANMLLRHLREDRDLSTTHETFKREKSFEEDPSVRRSSAGQIGNNRVSTQGINLSKVEECESKSKV